MGDNQTSILDEDSGFVEFVQKYDSKRTKIGRGIATIRKRHSLVYISDSPSTL